MKTICFWSYKDNFKITFPQSKKKQCLSPFHFKLTTFWIFFLICRSIKKYIFEYHASRNRKEASAYFVLKEKRKTLIQLSSTFRQICALQCKNILHLSHLQIVVDKLGIPCFQKEQVTFLQVNQYVSNVLKRKSSSQRRENVAMRLRTVACALRGDSK